MADHRIGSIMWHDLTVPNADSIRDFYTAVVGWRAEHPDEPGCEDYNMLAPGDATPVAGVCHAAGVNANLPPQRLIYITVDDAILAAERRVRLGGRVIDGPRGGGGATLCVIQDPAGAVCALASSSTARGGG